MCTVGTNHLGFARLPLIMDPVYGIEHDLASQAMASNNYTVVTPMRVASMFTLAMFVVRCGAVRVASMSTLAMFFMRCGACCSNVDGCHICGAVQVQGGLPAN